MDAWRLAVGTLTALRVTPPGRVDRDVARSAMLLAPLAVLPLAVAVSLVCWGGARLDLPPLAVGLLAVAALALGTRALHLDGLSDTADGLTASYDRARSLQVMRSGTSGPAGGAAVLLVLALQAVGFAALSLDLPRAVLAGVVVAASRCALSVTCARGVPGARADGLGETYVGTVPPLAAAASWIAVAALVATTLAWTGADWWRGPLACVLALAVVAILVRRAVHRFGGVTGDVFGAAIELALAALVLAVL